MTYSDISVFGRPSPSPSATASFNTDESGFPRDYVTLDLETTGFYPNRCAITEIGAVRVRNGRVIDQFQELINPLRPIPAQITALTGISDVMVADCDPIDEVLPRFIDWLADAPPLSPSEQIGAEPIVGHNVSFDLRFLDYNARHIAGSPFMCIDYDTMQISRVLFPEHRHHRLADLIVRFGIADNEEHRALSDAIQTQECFEWMRRYIHQHDLEHFGWRMVPAKTSADIRHRQLVLR